MFTITGLSLDDLIAIRNGLQRELHAATDDFLGIPDENSGSKQQAREYRERLVSLVNRM